MKKIGTKVAFLAITGMVLAALVSSMFIFFSIKSVLDDSLLTQCNTALRVLNSRTQTLSEETKLIAETLSADAYVIASVIKKDWTSVRNALDRAMTTNGFKIRNITVTDDAGIVIARLHSDDQGDSVINQPNVSGALKGETTSIISKGTAVKLGIRTGTPIKDVSGKIIGAISVIYSMDDPIFVDELKAITGNEYTVFLNDERINTTVINNGQRAIGTKLNPDIAKIVIEEKQSYTGQAEILGAIHMTAYEPILDSSGEAIGILFAGVPIQDIVDKEKQMLLMSLIVMLAFTALLIVLMAFFIKRMVSKPVKLMADTAYELSNGNLDTYIEFESKDEIGTLAESLRKTIAALRLYVRDISENLEKMADGDMTNEITQDYVGDFLPIKKSLVKISDSLNQTLTSINVAAEQVNSGAEQVSIGAQTLSQGATEQASSIEQLSASIIEVSTQVKDTAQNVKMASEYVADAGEGVIVSNEHMQNMLKAMTEINDSSMQISKIIKVIDDIAFQTNILALNAAVEAARAGSAGKGFAVVADEVRNLASKSAIAAKQTTALIETSVSSVDNGTQIAHKTAQALDEVRAKSKMVEDTINKIKVATEEQAAAVDQITQGVEQISTVVQTNSATSEESAAASEELSGQAAMLKQEIAHFRLKRNAPVKTEFYNNSYPTQFKCFSEIEPDDNKY